MNLVFDTYYFDENKANTICLVFENWESAHPDFEFSEIKEGVEEYIPGQFYKRELPCIISLLEKIKTQIQDISCIVIDGFVYLDDHMKPGLGKHLYDQLNGNIPVIGVAKTNFATVEKYKLPLKRGNSENPLYISSVGIEMNTAYDLIRKMNGTFRIPTLLKKVDTLTRQIN
ncbi:endonuclease V [Chryseobacterium sp. JUb7]|uniref:endonuclease V n=1 Tax=Chryseobacterium sp. JUb7 TaxID=2940599 RepID=UPI002167D224|nr:endonuclease V [Chryseobacterium sp. JUb7]MCS3528762.1 exodeoxyribonuclease-5/deoxyribonuclease V [Chryseobacterium sp. JUb7]